MKHRDNKKILQVLFDISDAITFTRNPKELYTAIQSALGKIFNLQNVYALFCHKEKPGVLLSYPLAENQVSYDLEVDLNETSVLSHQVICQKKPCLFFEQEIIRLLKACGGKKQEKISKIWLGAPLLIQQKVVGVVVLRSRTAADEYQQQDLVLLNTISCHIALAIERKESDENLAEQSKILQKIIETSPVGIAQVQNRVFKWVNNEMVSMFGYQSKQELENKNARIIYCSEQDYDRAGKLIYDGLSATGSADYDIDLIRKDGTCFPAHIQLSSEDRSNPMAWTIATFSNLSQRKAAKQARFEKERLYGVLEMAKTACHEMERPIQTIIHYLSRCQHADTLSYQEIQNLRLQALQIGKITRQLANLTRYKPFDSSDDIRMIDLWGSDRKTP
ncbi:MAG: PAS domain S-box protein [Pseudomonadota bacterium]